MGKKKVDLIIVKWGIVIVIDVKGKEIKQCCDFDQRRKRVIIKEHFTSKLFEKYLWKSDILSENAGH